MEVQWQLIVQLLLVTAVFGVQRDPRCPQEHKPDNAVMYPHSVDCRKFYVCLSNRTMVQKECPEGHQFDAESVACIETDESCDLNELVQKRSTITVPQNVYCRPDLDDMLIPNKADGCRSFYKCNSGTPILTQCSSNLLFNERTNYCDWDYNVQCDAANYAASRPSPYQLPNCQGVSDGTTYANYQTRCKSYFFCNQGERRHVYCTDDLLYNPAAGTCDWRGNVDCTCKASDCFGSPPEGGQSSSDSSSFDNDNSPPDTDGGNDWEDWGSEEVEEGETDRPLPTPEIRPPSRAPTSTTRPTSTWPTITEHPGPRDPDCVDCKPGEIDRPTEHPPIITPPPDCDHCLPGVIDTTRAPPVTTPPPTTTCLNIPTTTTTTRRTTTTTRSTTTTRRTTTTTQCPTAPPCPDPKLPLCPPQPCPPTNCIAQACIPQDQPWHKSNYNGPSITLTAIREAQKHNDRH